MNNATEATDLLADLTQALATWSTHEDAPTMEVFETLQAAGLRPWLKENSKRQIRLCFADSHFVAIEFPEDRDIDDYIVVDWIAFDAAGAAKHILSFVEK